MKFFEKRKKTTKFRDDGSEVLSKLGDNELTPAQADAGSNDNFQAFYDLGLKDLIVKAIREQKFNTPTTIQEKAIPLALAGKDIIAGSATGSGKTLAFGAGIIQNARKGGGIQALILTPTRELAEQVSRSMKAFAKHNRLHITSIYGGVSINPQFRELLKADIVVGTPGRVLDHINRKSLKLDRIKTLVLDEADTMLDMGFIKDVTTIAKSCPSERQTLLFSATITNDINALAKRLTNSPVRIMTESLVDPKKLTQLTYDVAKGFKFSLLVHLLKNENSELAMIFCNTRRTTDDLTRDLNRAGIAATAIHGGLSQDKRTKVINGFHSKRVSVLVCTDVAARGLDIKGVSHVYNYEIPIDSKQYVHRIGRTARAGKEGKAININLKRDEKKFLKVLHDNSIEIVRAKAPYIEKLNELSFA